MSWAEKNTYEDADSGEKNLQNHLKQIVTLALFKSAFVRYDIYSPQANFVIRRVPM